MAYTSAYRLIGTSAKLTELGVSAQDQLGRAGLSLAQIAKALLRRTLDEGQLCKDVDANGAFVNKINVHAKYKPCGGNDYAELTDARRKELNCGVDCTDTASGCFSWNAASLLERAKLKNDWSKVVPTVFRHRDFNGYARFASQPYVTVNGFTGNTTGNVTMYISIGLVAILEGTNMRLSDLEGALTAGGRSIANYHFGLLYKDANNPNDQLHYEDLGAANLTGANPGGDFSLHPAAPSFGSSVTYDCCFIVSQGTIGSSFYGCFIPKTYFQMRIAYFSIETLQHVDMEETTLPRFPQAGGNYSFYISGFEWYIEHGNEIPMSFSPSQGSVQSTLSEVQLTVGAATARALAGYVRQTIRVGAPGRTGQSGDFRKDFYIEQTCPVPTQAIELTDSQGVHSTNTLYFDSKSAGYEMDFYITANKSWVVKALLYLDDNDDWVDASSQIRATSLSGAITQTTTKTCVLENLIAIPTPRSYKIEYAFADAPTTTVYSVFLESI